MIFALRNENCKTVNDKIKGILVQIDFNYMIS